MQKKCKFQKQNKALKQLGSFNIMYTPYLVFITHSYRDLTWKIHGRSVNRLTL